MVARGPLPQADYERIYAQVPRLTVEVVVVSAPLLLLAMRQDGPCRGLWHLPGGTVRFGEHLSDAVQRVAVEEIEARVAIDGLLGYIEYPSHLARGIDWPVGIAFKAHLSAASSHTLRLRPGQLEWFERLPETMHDEQKTFLRDHGLAV